MNKYLLYIFILVFIYVLYDCEIYEYFDDMTYNGPKELKNINNINIDYSNSKYPINYENKTIHNFDIQDLLNNIKQKYNDDNKNNPLKYNLQNMPQEINQLNNDDIVKLINNLNQFFNKHKFYLNIINIKNIIQYKTETDALLCFNMLCNYNGIEINIICRFIYNKLYHDEDKFNKTVQIEIKEYLESLELIK